jgi:hypothetical protein
MLHPSHFRHSRFNPEKLRREVVSTPDPFKNATPEVPDVETVICHGRVAKLSLSNSAVMNGHVIVRVNVPTSITKPLIQIIYLLVLFDLRNWG